MAISINMKNDAIEEREGYSVTTGLLIVILTVAYCFTFHYGTTVNFIVFWYIQIETLYEQYREDREEDFAVQSEDEASEHSDWHDEWETTELFFNQDLFEYSENDEWSLDSDYDTDSEVDGLVIDYAEEDLLSVAEEKDGGDLFLSVEVKEFTEQEEDSIVAKFNVEGAAKIEAEKKK